MELGCLSPGVGVPASQYGGEGIRHDRAGGLWEPGQSRVLGGNDMMGPEFQEPLHGGAA